MESHNNTGKLLAYSLIIFVLLLSIIQIFIDGSALFFQLELLGFVVLLAFATFGLLNYNSRKGETVLFFFFLLYLGNLVLLWYFKNDLYFVLLLITLLGGILSVPKKTYHDSESIEESFIEEPHSVIFDTPQSTSQTVAQGSILLNAQRTTNIVPEVSQPKSTKKVKSTKARASKKSTVKAKKQGKKVTKRTNA